MTVSLANSCMMAAMVLLGCTVAVLATRPITAVLQQAGRQEIRNSNKVDITLFVMSRCPDAQAAEARFAEVMAVPGLSDIATLSTDYIAEPAHGRVAIACKHGPGECAGNKQQLCVQSITKGSKNVALFVPFLMCMDESKDRIGQLELADECMESVGYSASEQEDARECYTSEEGDGLLQESAEYTKRQGVTKSCTVYIDGRKRCILDGGRWQDCEDGSEVADFVSSVCDAYSRLDERDDAASPAVCRHLHAQTMAVMH